MISNVNFYSDLPVLDSFFDISDPAHYHSIPDNWYIGISDIVDSSKKIDEQKYKWVNILGASPIIGLMNESKKADLPFSFGGDGCAICFPAEYKDDVERVFKASKKTGKTAYDMDLRAGIYPISFIRDHGFDVQIARFKVSDFYNQAVFIGGGLNFVEDHLKLDKSTQYLVPYPTEGSLDVDFSGLECRWQEVKKKNRKVYSILVKANVKKDEEVALYNSVLTKMRESFGFDDNTNPVFVESLTMNLSPNKLSGEVKFRTSGQSWLKKLIYLLEVQIRTLLGKFFMKFDKKTSETDWKYYKPDMVANNDHKKFDDMLRLVISSKENQIKKFRSFLDHQFEASKLSYGIHESDSALVTCMVFAWHRQHIHFIDGNNGGYVRASKDLKKRMDRIQTYSSLTESS